MSACWQCQFWHRVDQYGNPAEVECSFLNGGPPRWAMNGLCKRRSPPAKGNWPEVYMNGTCGDFEMDAVRVEKVFTEKGRHDEAWERINRDMLKDKVSPTLNFIETFNTAIYGEEYGY